MMREAGVIIALCGILLLATGLDTFNLLLTSLTSSSLQVDNQGRSYVITGSSLLRFSFNLQLEQNISLSDTAATLSLSPDNQLLLVCLNGASDKSCSVYDTNNLTAPPMPTSVSIIGTGTASVISFSTEESFYIGSYQESESFMTVTGRMRLSQYIYGNNSGSAMVRSSDYEAFTTAFQRTLLFGFENAGFAYFVTVDPGNNRDFRVLRLCHATSCPGNAATCPTTALYEQAIICGNSISIVGGDSLCGANLVHDFDAILGPSLIVSRCREGRDNDNNVCVFNVSAINANMDMRYDNCIMGFGDIETGWGDEVTCRARLVS